MPELPEVETVRQGLSALLPEQPTIERVELIRGDLRRPINAKALAVLEGQRIEAVRRRAKYLLMDTSNHRLISHLGMTGSWRIAPRGSELTHDHFYLHLQDGRRLAFHDPRRFGLLEVVGRREEAKLKNFQHLGPEPLDAMVFNGEWIFSRTRGRKSSIKS